VTHEHILDSHFIGPGHAWSIDGCALGAQCLCGNRRTVSGGRIVDRRFPNIAYF
jgi:hypothetical protein